MEVNDPKDQESRYEQLKKMAADALKAVQDLGKVKPKPVHKNPEDAVKYLRKTGGRG